MSKRALAILILAALAIPVAAQEQALVHVAIETPAPGLARPVLTVNRLLPPGGASLNLTLSIVTQANLECTLDSPLLAGFLAAAQASAVAGVISLEYSGSERAARISGWLSLATNAGVLNFTRVRGWIDRNDTVIVLGRLQGNASAASVAGALQSLAASTPLSVEYNETAITIRLNRSLPVDLPGWDARLEVRVNGSATTSLSMECEGYSQGDPAVQAGLLGAMISQALGLPYNLSLATPVYLRAYTLPNGSIVIELPAIDLQATSPGLTPEDLASDIASGLKSRLGENATIKTVVHAPGNTQSPSGESPSPVPAQTGGANGENTGEDRGTDTLVLAVASLLMAAVAAVLILRMRSA